MKNRHQWALMILAFLAVSACSTQNTVFDSQPKATEYVVRQSFSQPVSKAVYQLSPDGRKLAWLEADGEAINLRTRDLDSGEIFETTAVDDARVADFGWASNDHLMFYTVAESKLLMVDYDGSNGRMLRQGYYQVIHRMPQDPELILVAAPDKTRFGYPSVYTLNLTTGQIETRVARGPWKAFPRQWLTTADGELVAAVIEDKGDEVVLYLDQEDQEWHETRRVPLETADIHFLWAPLDGTVGLATSVPDFGPDIPSSLALYKFDYATGERGEMLLYMDGMECCAILERPARTDLLAASSASEADSQTVYFDPRLESISAKLSEQLGESTVQFIQLTDDESMGLVMAGNPLTAPGYHLYDFSSESLLPLQSPGETLAALDSHRQETHQTIAVIEGGSTFNRRWLNMPSGVQDYPTDQSPFVPVVPDGRKFR